MLVLNALMRQPVSLSSWGQFDVGRLPVEFKAMDYGIVQTPRGEEYLSVFFLGSDVCESRVCADQDLNDVESDVSRLYARRVHADLLVLAEMGLDVETIEWDSALETNEDRARWRTANFGRH